MDKILIGSAALTYCLGSHKDFREPKDSDYAVKSKENFTSTRETEFHELPMLFNYCEREIANPSILLTLKLSHCLYDIHWDKTIHDIHYIISKGVLPNQKLLIELKKHWDKIHGVRKVPDFNQSTEDFFDDYVDRKMPHDELHQIVKHHEYPAYQDIVKGFTVKPDIDLFNQLSFDRKMDVVQEEVLVLALERWPDINFTVAYRRALKKMIVSLFPEEISMWCIYNFPVIKKQPDWFKKQVYDKINIQRIN